MASQSDTDMGINSWLEDEFYQQYLHDRSAVDESWKQVFAEGHPAGSPANGTTAPAVRPSATPAPPAPAGEAVQAEQLQPLRGGAAASGKKLIARRRSPGGGGLRPLTAQAVVAGRGPFTPHTGPSACG